MYKHNEHVNVYCELSKKIICSYFKADDCNNLYLMLAVQGMLFDDMITFPVPLGNL